MLVEVLAYLRLKAVWSSLYSSTTLCTKTFVKILALAGQSNRLFYFD